MSKVSKRQEEAKAASEAKRSQLRTIVSIASKKESKGEASKGGSNTSVPELAPKILSDEEKALAGRLSVLNARTLACFDERSLQNYISKCGGDRIDTKGLNKSQLKDILRK